MLGQLSIFPVQNSLPLRQRVQVEIISLQDARYALEKFHYLHRVRVGRQINYAVLIDGVVDGVITYAYPMISVPIQGVPSDELLEFARLFLASNIPHTATCAIGKTLKRIKQDWLTYYPDAKPPRLVVSWSDTTLHKGTIYKAANFQWIKRTEGHAPGTPRKADWNNPDSKRRSERAKHGDYTHEKDCWIYWLKG